MSRPEKEDPATADRFRRLERRWQDEMGHAFLEKPYEHAGSKLVFEAQHHRIEAALGELPDGPLVEVGCGLGQLLGYLRQRPLGKNRLLVGIDVSIAVSHVPALGAAAIRGDGEFLPLVDGSIAGLVYSGSLHHVIGYQKAVREAMRALRPGGKLVIFEPSSSVFSRFVHRVLDPIVFRASLEYESPVDQHYKHVFREEKVRRELEVCGAKITLARSDFFAYPLTGCYASSPFARSPRFMQWLLSVEHAVERTPIVAAIAGLAAWRFTITAEKPRSTSVARPIAHELFDVVACPTCKGSLERTSAQELACPACRLAYRIEDGIPILLVDEARRLE